jgi:glycosyltransferase involved in cell wall biosynthesis
VRVLLCHTFYRSSAPSGEDAVYRTERELLEAAGVEVIPYELHNDDLDEGGLFGKARIALEGIWSRRTYEELFRLVRRTRPHVAHFHNTFPQITPSGWAACRENGVPVVQTLHNFRYVCPGALLTREGRPCEECLGRMPLPALRHRCYRGSLAATAAQFAMIAANRLRGSFSGLVNRYVALTSFAAGRLAAGGIPAGRITVVPNFLPHVPPPLSGGRYAVFVGRLAPEKGVATLLEAWRRVGDLPLVVLGDGPLRSTLEERARREGLPVEFRGARGRDEVLAAVRGAALQVVPSEWYEGFPLVLLEAFACGTPVVVSRIGSLDELVEEGVAGLKFTPGDPAELATKVAALVADHRLRERMGGAARACFEELYTAERHLDLLMEVYRQARNDAMSGGVIP